MTIQQLGVFTAGEIPDPLEYTFLDADGAPMTDITSPDWTATFRLRPRHGDAVEGDATVADGVATYTWGDGGLDAAGSYRGEFTVTDGTNTFISEPIRWYARAAIPAPSS